MKTKVFNVSFIGRKVGAIGITYRINTQITALENSPVDEIKLLCYSKYEHISDFKVLNHKK